MSGWDCGLANHGREDHRCPPITPAPVPSEADPGTGGRESDPTYCWAEPDNGHKWEARSVCNDSGIPLDYICRWCTREVSEIPRSVVLATPDAGDVEALAKVIASRAHERR